MLLNLVIRHWSFVIRYSSGNREGRILTWHTLIGELELHPETVGAHSVRPSNRKIYTF